MRVWAKSIGAAAVLGAAVLLGACEQKVTLTNYDKIGNGMSLSQVQNILGSGEDATASGTSISYGGVADSKTSNEKTMVFKGGSLTVTVIFKDGKVVQKSKQE